MHPELENIINIAIKGGTVSDRQREIIINKAKKLGIDEVEAEIYLDARINEIANQSASIKAISEDKSDPRIIDTQTNKTKKTINPAEALHSIDQKTDALVEKIKTQKLYRSVKGRIIFGLCSGLAKYLNTSVTLIRLLFILPLLVGIIADYMEYELLWSFAAFIGVGAIYIGWSFQTPKEKYNHKSSKS